MVGWGYGFECQKRLKSSSVVNVKIPDPPPPVRTLRPTSSIHTACMVWFLLFAPGVTEFPRLP